MELSGRAEGGRFVLEFVDGGRPVDVLLRPDPDTTAGLDAREVGGLGIDLMRRFADEVRYRSEHGRNVLSMAYSGLRAGAAA